MSCPYQGKEDSIDPTTNMPRAEILQASHLDASQSLDTEREISTIPRTQIEPSADKSVNDRWVYPSPRMFYNALKRKGFETAPEDIEMMVGVHNWLNESVWEEIKKWESRHSTICQNITLKRFMGRPNDLTPKAWLYHKVYGGERPFDRHDWTVDRCGKEVRYVIDYYSSGQNDASFVVDVRPALDSPSAFIDRIRNFFTS